MKFIIDEETQKEYERRINAWTPWYAWHFVKVGPGDWRIFEKVWRRGDVDHNAFGATTTWEYKAYIWSN